MSNEINDVIFTGSPLDEYLQSLISNNNNNSNDNNDNDNENESNDFGGSLLSEIIQTESIDFNQLQNEQNLKEQEEQQLLDSDKSKSSSNNNNNNHIKDDNNINTSTDNNNSIYKYIIKIVYNNYCRFRINILESDMLLPSESPFINSSLVTLDLPPPIYIDSINNSNSSSSDITNNNNKNEINRDINIKDLLYYLYISILKNNNNKNTLNRQHQSLQSLFEQSFKYIQTQLDIISRSIKLVREVELISKGYRFSSPVIPIERIEIDKVKSEKSLVLRASIAKIIRHSTLAFKEDLDRFANLYIDNSYIDAYLKSNIIDDNIYFINNNNNNNSNSNSNSNSNNENEMKSQEEIDSQLPILTIKSMFYQYQTIISNYYTMLMFILADQSILLHNNGQAVLKVIKFNERLEESLDNLTKSIRIESNTLKNIISNEIYDNKIPSRIILNRPKKTVLESFLYNNNQMLESVQSSINPMLTKINNIITPLTSTINNNNSINSNHDAESTNNNNDDKRELEIDLVTLDDIVNDFLVIKSELSNSLKYWELANRSLISIVKSVDRNLPELSEEEAKQRIQRLIESLRKNTLYNNEFDDDNNNNGNNDSSKRRQYIDLNSIIHDPLDDDGVFEAYTGELGDDDQDDQDEIEFYKQQQQQQQQQLNNDLDSTPITNGIPPPPPPLPADGMIPKKKNPPKRTVYDPTYVENKQKKKRTTNYSLFTPVVPPEKKMINELKSVLDVITLNKETIKKKKNDNSDIINNDNQEDKDNVQTQ
ncbi:hypothetical protein PPL_02971 [Heterostelium album PN500]|uniref:Myosin-binding domain-containing protein n=1 Tax=Heterostelium pallidum (strain ATCC 26659 / Pp 5 / PN500) TaxID=670386 RepID=D3B3K3_HETP5|nr:hypothetical protein PPL_02971 [Heterostelium album PN500]EFA83901.1 hypothetical protein PPL_02971 [Heterostelium album PN500]|eukprot:XP_020436018.1 hypothetical protein PPL_02971 [Heterostelium album PN500]